jgi:hypothetical protein
MHADPSIFKRCSTCRQPIPWKATYYTCSVSTCNRPRTALFFCSVACWDAHVPEARHRDAWAEEQQAPSLPDSQTEELGAHDEVPVAKRRMVNIETIPSPPDSEPGDAPHEVLVVMSKLKNYVRIRSGMNTSDRVADALSEHLRHVLAQAIREAARQDRKTVLDRDVAAVVARFER